ncbi:MAG: 16S rRNA (cytidine(1402)-2'-O)-methyltransferase [Hominenteromicrobium sp.]
MEENKLEKGALYVVATPIGNLSDFSPRAAETLAGADFIAAEDTRVTMKLLNHFGIKKPLVSYYEHNKQEKGSVIVDRIAAGETCALVSDAGMPAISDPGEDLVALCAARGIRVLVVPGPSAVISALAVSGLPTGRFTFEGFLSVNKKSRREHLESVRGEVRTMVFYEAPHKLPYTLSDMAEVFGDRRIALVREITKIHEECIRTTLFKAAKYYAEHAPRGEFVLVIEGAKPEEKHEMTLEDAAALARKAMENGSSASDAAKEAAKLSGFKKGEIYRLLTV